MVRNVPDLDRVDFFLEFLFYTSFSRNFFFFFVIFVVVFGDKRQRMLLRHLCSSIRVKKQKNRAEAEPAQEEEAGLAASDTSERTGEARH